MPTAPAPARQPASFAKNPLNTLVGYALRRIQADLMAHLGAELGPLGLRPVTFSVLAVIEASESPSQSDICDVLGIQRTNFVAIAAELEEDGLIARSLSTTDRRQYVLSLTREGAGRLKRAWRVVHAHEDRIDERLGTDGKAQLLALLERLGAQPLWTAAQAADAS
jgi:DNA-binding MarR family transcriptional regulator